MTGQQLLSTFNNHFEADLAIAKLKDAGVTTWVIDKQDSSYMTFGEIQVYVTEEDMEKARELIHIETE